MSGPPSWLAYAWAASLWVAAGCVGVAVAAAVVDWHERRTARGSPENLPFPALIASRRRPNPLPALPPDIGHRERQP